MNYGRGVICRDVNILAKVVSAILGRKRCASHVLVSRYVNRLVGSGCDVIIEQSFGGPKITKGASAYLLLLSLLTLLSPSQNLLH